MDTKKNMKIHCASGGGCSTTFLLSELERLGFNINHWKGKGKEGHKKHSPIPHIDHNDIFIYIYSGDPSAGIQSVFRRGQQIWHYLNMRQIAHNQHGRISRLNFLNNIDAFRTHNKDEFLLENQFDNWVNCSTDKPIIFLKYPDYFLYKHIFYNLLNINEDFLSYQKRETIPNIEIECLRPLRDKIKKLPAISYRNISLPSAWDHWWRK